MNVCARVVEPRRLVVQVAVAEGEVDGPFERSVLELGVVGGAVEVVALLEVELIEVEVGEPRAWVDVGDGPVH